ncbi:MAG: hypothetical protein GX278_05105 [Aeromonadales bacterium]|nr:hypothetical protein [Aeromonadales bacterium]
MKLPKLPNNNISKKAFIISVLFAGVFCILMCFIVHLSTMNKSYKADDQETLQSLDQNLKHAKNMVQNLKDPKKSVPHTTYTQSVKENFKEKNENSHSQTPLNKTVRISKVNDEDYLKEYVIYKEKNNLNDRGFDHIYAVDTEAKNDNVHLRNVQDNSSYKSDDGKLGFPVDRRYESYKDALKSGTKVSLTSLKRESATPVATEEKKKQESSPINSYNGLENHDTTLNESVQKPKTPYALMQGSVVRATLLSGINSSLPGQIVALISQDIYDSITGDHLLIPRGSRLIGQYDTKYAYGEKRLFLGFNRMIFPNGHSLNLGAMPGQATDGYAGFNADVDNHYFKNIINCFFLSSIRSQNDAVAYNLSTRQTLSEQDRLALDFAKESSQNMTNILGRDVNLSPTLTVKPGYAFALAITKDIFFDSPYGVVKREITFK